MQSKAFTKLFASITDSSIWSEDDATRIVWITMLAMSDSHGYVGASIPGLAARSRKSVGEVEAALEKFRSPDPYSRTRDHDGRRISDADGGWVLLNYEKHRSVVQAEADKAKKRRWAAKFRAEAKEAAEAASESRPVDHESRPERSSVDFCRPRPSASASGSGSGSDLDPEGVQGEPIEVQGRRVVFRDLGDWQPPDSLVADAVAAGLTREEFDARVDILRQGPIGGARGVYDRTEYVRKQIGRWRTWAEVDRAKALSAAAAGPRNAFGGGRDQRGPLIVEASESDRRFAQKHGVDLNAIMSHLHTTRAAENLGVGRAREMVRELLVKRAREQAKAKAGAA